MKTIKLIPLVSALMLTVVLVSCGPSYVGVGTSPGYGYGPGYYGGAYRAPYGYYRRPPVIVQRRTYVVPRYSSPNARSYGSGRNYGSSRSYGGRSGGSSRGPR